MKKSHNNQAAQVEKIDLSDSLADHPFIQWVSQNGKNLLWILLALIIFFLLFNRFTGGSGGTEANYLSAENEFITFQKSINGKSDPKVQKESLDKLKAILKSYPALQAKYDGPIAQTLIDQGDIKEATTFVDRTLAR